MFLLYLHPGPTLTPPALTMSSSSFLLLAATAACIFWALWLRPWSVTAARLDLPLVELDDADNARDEAELKQRYTNETGKVLKKGYDKVRGVVLCSYVVHLLTRLYTST